MISLVENITSALKPLETRAVDRYVEEHHPKIKSARKDRRNKDNGDTNTEDKGFTTISVKALILFLEDFLESRLNIKLHDSIKDKSTISPWLKQQRSNDVQPRKAASAYAHAAETASMSVNKISHSDAPELSSIYALIKDLRRLQENGVKYLNMNGDDEFISSIISAVNSIKKT